MGLDMYLEKRHYVKNWNHTEESKRHTVMVTRGDQPSGIKPERVTMVIEEIAYWRKANAIHAWFVEHVQGGRDECQDSEVSREQLQELLATVETVLKCKKKARELLPTQGGFFFGNTEYGADYITDLNDTKRQLTEALAEPDNGGYFVYHASW